MLFAEPRIGERCPRRRLNVSAVTLVAALRSVGIRSRRRRDAAGRIDRVGLFPILDDAADRILVIGGGVLRRPVGQMIERIELRRRDRLELQKALGQRPRSASGLSSCPHSARNAAISSRSWRTSLRSLARRSAWTVESNLIR